ncbi:MAG TPA: hypothetical protein VMQ17_08850 [Candidatus Sulfotelmatobacter sp.]|nr:hypothetical protein [Candidatus Sulfotelmatobacter sp.]
MNWIRRNWFEIVLSVLFLVWLWGMISASGTLPAHAQNPEPSTSGNLAFTTQAVHCFEGEAIVIGDGPQAGRRVAVCKDHEYQQVVDLDSWIEQHCVAVLPAHTEDLSGIAHDQVLYSTPEQTLKLRCTP